MYACISSQVELASNQEAMHELTSASRETIGNRLPACSAIITRRAAITLPCATDNVEIQTGCGHSPPEGPLSQSPPHSVTLPKLHNWLASQRDVNRPTLDNNIWPQRNDSLGDNGTPWEDSPDYRWSISRKTANKIAHAMNGNTTRPSGSHVNA